MGWSLVRIMPGFVPSSEATATSMFPESTAKPAADIICRTNVCLEVCCTGKMSCGPMPSICTHMKCLHIPGARSRTSRIIPSTHTPVGSHAVYIINAQWCSRVSAVQLAFTTGFSLVNSATFEAPLESGMVYADTWQTKRASL